MRHNAGMATRIRRRRLIWGTVALALLLGCGYAYVTRPAALRGRVIDVLGEFGLRVTQIGEISFSPTGGLKVLNVEVAADEASPLAGVISPSGQPPLLRVDRVRVRINPWMLLLGRFEAREVELGAPAIAVVWPKGERVKSSMRWTGLPEPPDEIPARLPRLRIEQGEIELFELEHGRLNRRRRWMVNGWGALSGGVGAEPRSYVVRLDEVGGAARSAAGPAVALVEVRFEAGRLTAELGWVDLRVQPGLIPQGWRELADRLHVAGLARASKIELDGAGLVRIEFDCDGLACTIPIETDIEDSETKCFARLTNATGKLALVRSGAGTTDASSGIWGRLQARVDGRLNDASASAELSLEVKQMTGAARTSGAAEASADGRGANRLLEGLGDFDWGAYHAEARIDGLTLPTLKDNPRFVTSERLPEALRSWMRKYDATGRVKLTAVLDGDGPGAAVRYEGAIDAQGGSCRYFRFPYRISDARGRVRFSNDGIVFDGLSGRRGAGRIRADGRMVDSTSWTGFELSFRGHNITSDAALYAALPPEYQALWRSAAPVGVQEMWIYTVTEPRLKHTSCTRAKTAAIPSPMFPMR